MANTQALNKDTKNKILNILSEDLIRGLESGELPVDESRESSRFLLSEIDNAETEEDALLIVQTLATRWTIYQRGYFQIREAVLKKKDQQQIHNIEERLKYIKQQ